MATQIKVYGHHIDVFNHVNNARYLEFYEEARWAWLENHNLLNFLLKNNLGMVAVNININYCQGAVLFDQLTVISRLERIGTKSASCYQQIIREKNGKKTLISDVTVTFVFVELATNKSVVISGELLEHLEPLLQGESDQFIEVN
ncbi:acyl-CoA thioesterase [Providencia sneebia]|uniref:4-hydroxybenzoyl-CoA thioesterase n=1 Tax=Providencia sneebia DSM 19967 TaxID=1141660 RepID=K8WBA2_9GAMM|nr:thioesterase family protein [Providencia sneebia]EKT53515.1 4-hydroxybenzoyl-CoA thioesterase [Providencia sneebia DSM 19967]